MLVKARLVYVYPELARVSAAAMRSCYSSWPAHKLFLDRKAFPDSEVTRMLRKALELGHLDVLEHGFASWAVEAGAEEMLDALVEWLPEIAPWTKGEEGAKPVKQAPKPGYPEGAEVWLLSYTEFEKLGGAVPGLGLEEERLHGGFTFSISGVTRSFTHQLVRHRLAAYSQQSQRHVRVARGEAWYGVPPRLPREAAREYREFMARVASFYSRLVEAGTRKEDARFVLPNATLTHITMTATAWEYLKMFSLRVDPAAQWEIRDVAWAMLGLAMLVAPQLFTSLEEPAWLSSSVRERFEKLMEAVERSRGDFRRLEPGGVFELEIPDSVQEHSVKAYVVKQGAAS